VGTLVGSNERSPGGPSKWASLRGRKWGCSCATRERGEKEKEGPNSMNDDSNFTADVKREQVGESGIDFGGVGLECLTGNGLKG